MRRLAFNSLLVVASLLLVFGASCLALSVFGTAEPRARFVGAGIGLATLAFFLWVLMTRSRWLRCRAIYASFGGLRDAVAGSFSPEVPGAEDIELLEGLAKELGNWELSALYEKARARRTLSREEEARFCRIAEAIFRVMSSETHRVGQWRAK